MENPFVLQPYKNAELFCDREKETKEIIDDLLNGRRNWVSRAARRVSPPMPSCSSRSNPSNPHCSCEPYKRIMPPPSRAAASKKAYV